MSAVPPLSTSRTRGPEDMSRLVGHLITLLAFALPLTLVSAVGMGLGNEYTAIGLAAIWCGIFVVSTLRFQRKRTFLVMERFGLFWDVKFAGPRMLIPWIDHQILEDHLLQKAVRLFVGADGTPTIIDCVGGSITVVAEAWYQIADPEAVESGDYDSVRKQIQLYAYRIRADELDKRVAQLFEHSFRDVLEVRQIYDVQANMAKLVELAITGVRPSLAEIGIYPFPGRGITVSDIILSKELIGFREQQTRGQAAAEEAAQAARGIYEPILRMKQGLKSGAVGATGDQPGEGLELTDEQVLDTYLKLKGLETVKGSNITLVASDMDKVLKTVSIGSTSTKQGDAS